MQHKTLIAMFVLVGAQCLTPAYAADLVTGGYSREFQQMGMMKMLDADGDHTVTQAEFNQYYTTLFNTLDQNQDGFLDKAEWVGQRPAKMTSLTTGGYSRELSNLKMMDAMDANKDHKVSKDEFLQFQATVFSALDKSGDKQLDAQEFVAKLVGR